MLDNDFIFLFREYPTLMAAYSHQSDKVALKMDIASKTQAQMLLDINYKQQEITEKAKIIRDRLKIFTKEEMDFLFRWYTGVESFDAIAKSLGISERSFWRKIKKYRDKYSRIVIQNSEK